MTLDNPALTRRYIAALVVAKSISDVGFALDFVCLGIFVWLRTESVAATGLLGFALYAGGIVGGRLGHRYGAHWDRRQVMIAADLARMAMLAMLALAPDGGQLWLLFPAVFVIGGGRSVFEATLSAATPVLAPERTQLLNSVLSGVKGVALVLGMGLATVAVPVIGFRGVFLLDALTYALSAAVLLMLPLRLREGVARPSATGPKPALSQWLATLGAGIVLLLGVRGLDALGSASHHVGLPILGDARDPQNPAAVTGALWMAWAAGMVVGSFALRPLLARLITNSAALVFFLATVVMSSGFIGIFWLSAYPLMLTVAAIAGLGDALSEITFKQALQKLPDERRGPAFGLSQIVINSGFVAGLLLTSAVLVPDRVADWVLLLHGVPVLAALLAAGWTARSLLRSGRALAHTGDRR